MNARVQLYAHLGESHCAAPIILCSVHALQGSASWLDVIDGVLLPATVADMYPPPASNMTYWNSPPAESSTEFSAETSAETSAIVAGTPTAAPIVGSVPPQEPYSRRSLRIKTA